MRQRRLRAGETAVGSLGCSGNRGLEIKPVARTGSDPVLASIKRRGTEMPQLDWKAEYAHTTGMQAFIYGFPYMYNAQLRHDWVTSKRNPDVVPYAAVDHFWHAARTHDRRTL
jgi:hypothetical protein